VLYLLAIARGGDDNSLALNQQEYEKRVSNIQAEALPHLSLPAKDD
jgi:hypothetical protein